MANILAPTPTVSYTHLDIAALEAQLAQVQADQAAQATDYVALQALQEKQAELEAALEQKMDRWVYLNDLAERIANQ